MGSQASIKGSQGGHRVTGSDGILGRSWGHRQRYGHGEVMGSQGS